jgi:two-component system response regulator TctD
MRLLIVEDDRELSQALVAAFARISVHCDHAATAADAEALIGNMAYTLIVLDLGLPDDDGLAVLKRMRSAGETVPVIILTARGDSQTRIAGLRGGADDFLVKPFLFDELHARVEAVLRRQGRYVENQMTFGPLVFDVGSREATIDGARMALSAREADMLEPLLRRSGHVVPKRFLEDQLFGSSETFGSNAIEVYVHRLRRKIETSGSGLSIVTVRGVGYMLTGG